MRHVTLPLSLSTLMFPPSSSSSSTASSLTSPSSPPSFHGLPAEPASSSGATLPGGDVDEADDTDDDWEDGASYFPSRASLPSFSALPLPSLSSLPATLSSASSSLAALLSSLPSLSSIPPSDLRQLQSTLQSLLSDSLENVVHHAKLFARVGGDWWQGREREKERHTKLVGQRRRQKGRTGNQASKPRGEDKEMAEYVAFLTQLVQATGSDWEVVREERDEGAVMSGQRLTVVEEHFGQWDERERRMVDRIREELKAAKKKEGELTAATDITPPPDNDETESVHEKEEFELAQQREQQSTRHDAASNTSELPLPYEQPSAVDLRARDCASSPAGDTADLHAHRPPSSAAGEEDISAAPRRPSSSSSVRHFNHFMPRSSRTTTPVPASSSHSPWLSPAAPLFQSHTPGHISYSPSPSTLPRSLEASGYWNTHTQLFIPSSQHAALVSYQAPAAPPLFTPPSLSRSASRVGSSVVNPAVTLPFTPLAAVVASLVSADNINVSSATNISPHFVSELPLSPASSTSLSAHIPATVTSLPPATASSPTMHNAARTDHSFNLPSPDVPIISHSLLPSTHTSLSTDLPLSSCNPLDFASQTVTLLPSSLSSLVPAVNKTPLASPTAPAPSTPLALSALAQSAGDSADAPPAPPLDVPVAPPMDGVPVAPPFDSSIPLPPPMSSPTAHAAALPPPLALSSSTTSPAKRSSMKRLHWSKLRYENVQQSVWSRLLQSGASEQDGLVVDVEAMKLLIDVSELEDKFTSSGATQKDGSARDSTSTRPTAKPNKKATSGSSSGQAQVEDERRDNSTAVNSTRNKVSQFTAVDTLRAYNVEIAFSQLKTPADTIKKSLLLDGWQLDEAEIAAYLSCVQHLVSPVTDAAAAVDSPPITALPTSPLAHCPLSADQLDILSRIVPSDEEVTRTVAAAPSATPGTVEQFFRAMCSIPRVRRRVELLAFLCNAPTELLCISASLTALHHAHTAILSSPSLRRFLALVLLVGNTLNAGTSQGNAYGFRLSWLSEMAQVKTRDGRETMMEFIVRTAEKPTSAATPSLSLLSELQAVPAAAAIDTQSLAASLASLRSFTTLATREASLLPANETLHRLLTAWVAGWQNSVKAVEASYDQMLTDGKELCRYLAEDDSRSEGAISVVRDVLVLYSKAKDEGERKQREQREKLKANEREKEKQERRQQRKAGNDAASIPTATLLSCTSRVAQQTGPRRRKFVRSSQLSSDALEDEAGVVARVAAVSPSCSPCSSPSSTSLSSSLHQSGSCSSLQYSLTSMSSSLSSHSPAS